MPKIEHIPTDNENEKKELSDDLKEIIRRVLTFSKLPRITGQEILEQMQRERKEGANDEESSSPVAKAAREVVDDLSPEELETLMEDMGAADTDDLIKKLESSAIDMSESGDADDDDTYEESVYDDDDDDDEHESNTDRSAENPKGDKKSTPKKKADSSLIKPEDNSDPESDEEDIDMDDPVVKSLVFNIREIRKTDGGHVRPKFKTDEQLTKLSRLLHKPEKLNPGELPDLVHGIQKVASRRQVSADEVLEMLNHPDNWE